MPLEFKTPLPTTMEDAIAEIKRLQSKVIQIQESWGNAICKNAILTRKNANLNRSLDFIYKRQE